MDSNESALFELLLYMTGREDRLSRKPLLTSEQEAAFEAIWPILRSPIKRGTSRVIRDSLNRLLLSLGIQPISLAFCETVFGGIDFASIDQIRERIEKFRILCMLEYGNFRYGYKMFRESERIRSRWSEHFPDGDEVNKRTEDLRDRLEPAGLQQISGSEIFALGYLAVEHASEINQARESLRNVLDSAVQRGTKNIETLDEEAKRQGVANLIGLAAKAGVPEAEALFTADLSLIGKNATYRDAILYLRDACAPVNQEAIVRIKKAGMQNARTYMAMHDLDVYVATSMRDPLHFTTNWAFVRRLFHQGDLAAWQLRYFDPTQAYLEDRVRKGLLECLMIKRAKLTVYNAQEADTFGKDAEAGVTLAQGKPVVVYVARLFESLPRLAALYQAIDRGPRVDRNSFIDSLFGEGFLEQQEREELLRPEKTKGDAVACALQKHATRVVTDMSEKDIQIELMRQGYDPKQTNDDVRSFAVQLILLFERRALTFRDVHPLSLQTSPIDGVARGVIVTRSVEDTAHVVSGILLGRMEYEVREDNDNWLLMEKRTQSPVRVVTKDAVLTTAFWSEQWGYPES